MKEKGSPQRHKTQTSHINTDLDSYKGNLYLVKDKHFPTLISLWQHFFISTMTFTLTLSRTYRALKTALKSIQLQSQFVYNFKLSFKIYFQLLS